MMTRNVHITLAVLEVFVLAACLLLFSGLLTLSLGRTYYVAPTGFDSGPGTQARPFLTLQQAANSVGPGDTVIVRNGLYTTKSMSHLVAVTRSGKPNAWITFKSENPLGAKLSGSNNLVQNGVEFRGSSYVKLLDFELYGFGKAQSGGGAIWVDATAHSIYIGGNYIHHIGELCTGTANEIGRAHV